MAWVLKRLQRHGTPYSKKVDATNMSYLLWVLFVVVGVGGICFCDYDMKST